jgi:hypothetical protein
MKKLLLVLLVCGIAIMSGGQNQAVAAADCVVWHYYYYDYPGGTNCGLMYVFCSGNIYQQGCQTQYYNEYYNTRCYCPYL